MSLISNQQSKFFNTNEIKRGDLIRLKYDADTESKNGIVAQVTPDKILIIYLPGTANVTNFISLSVEEAEKWLIIEWSSDLTVIKSFNGGTIDGKA